MLGEVGRDLDPAGAGFPDEVAQQRVVGVNAVGAEGWHKIPELLQESEVALGGIDVTRAHVDPSAAHQTVEALVEDAAQ